MSEVIERAAKAAYSKWIEGVESLEPPWEQMPEDFRYRMIDAQRAAIESMREATPVMTRAFGFNALIAAMLSVAAYLDGAICISGGCAATAVSFIIHGASQKRGRNPDHEGL